MAKIQECTHGESAPLIAHYFHFLAEQNRTNSPSCKFCNLICQQLI